MTEFGPRDGFQAPADADVRVQAGTGRGLRNGERPGQGQKKRRLFLQNVRRGPDLILRRLQTGLTRPSHAGERVTARKCNPYRLPDQEVRRQESQYKKIKQCVGW